MRKSNVVILTVVFLTCIAGGIYATIYHQGKQRRDREVAVYRQLNEVLNNFHVGVKALSPSVEGKKALQDELRKLNILADAGKDNLRRIEAEVHSLPQTPTVLLLQEAAEKADKYLQGYKDLSHLSVTADSVTQRAETMIDYLNNYRVQAELFGSADQGDTTESIQRIDLVCKSFKKELDRKSIPLQGSGSGSGGPSVVVVRDSGSGGIDWSPYSGYRNSIRSIVSRYSDGRSELYSILTAFDRTGTLTSDQFQRWSGQLMLRRNLISELSMLDTPPGSEFRNQQNALLGMLEAACDSMEMFQNDPNGSTRKNISRVSDNNSEIMHRIERFYGLR